MDFIISFIRRTRRKLNNRIMLDSIVKSIMWGVASMLVIMLLSLVVPIYTAPLIGAAFIVVSLIAGIVYGTMRKVSERDAALYIDRFGFKEKIITAYEKRDNNENVYLLQREDAEKVLRKRCSEVKVGFKVSWGRIGIILIMLAMIFTAGLLPTPARIKAKENAITRQKAKEAEKETKELLDALNKIDKSQLSPEELEKLNKMLESIELSKEDIKKAKNQSELNNARMRYDYKLGDISDELSQMEAGKNSSAAKSIKSANEIAKTQNKSYNMVASNPDSKTNPADPNNPNGQNQNDPNGQNQNGQNDKNGQNQNDPNGQNQNGQNGQNNQNGQNGNNSGNSNDPNDPNNQNGQNSQNQNGQNGNSGNANGQNGNSGNANGQNGQSGQNGQGSQSGNGSGSGSGQGTGSNEHSVEHNHDYVSIDEHVNGKYGDNSTSEYTREQNGLAWNGKKVPYNSVINDYSNAAYDGIEKGKYPGSMSKVIKDYFSGLEN